MEGGQEKKKREPEVHQMSTVRFYNKNNPRTVQPHDPEQR